MIAALALALVAQQDLPEEIVITGRPQPLQISVRMDSKRRVTACQIAKSSGDAVFDQLTCETVAACSREKDRSLKAIKACTQASMTSVDNDQSGAAADAAKQ
ncbi:hypothetical protein AB2M62_14565 [Sphingomonas sp. MMS12-HWE2-04]|uniref:hypothetical protein n=1 Tax=Sphingomonas sp. MMS12-HWE2-04 TaxID=3234199 RepID=UPI00384CFF99